MTLHTFTVHSKCGSQVIHNRATPRDALEAYVDTLEAYAAEAVATIVCHDTAFETTTMSFMVRRDVYIDGSTRTVTEKSVQLQAEVDVLRGVHCAVVQSDGSTSPPCGVCLKCVRLELDAAKAQLVKLRPITMQSPAVDQWYSIDEHGDIETHDTDAEACAAAQYTIDNALQDHWPEGMNRVQWGYLHAVQTCEEKDRVDAPPKPDGFKSVEEHAAAIAARDAWVEERGDVEWWCRYELENTTLGNQRDATKALDEIAKAKFATIVARGAVDALRLDANTPMFRWHESQKTAKRREDELAEVVMRVCDDKLRESVKTSIEVDGRWIADFESIPGAMVYGHDEERAIYECIELVKKVAIDRCVAGET
jgi:hypothetical protein